MKKPFFAFTGIVVILFLSIKTYAQQSERTVIVPPLQFTTTVQPNIALTGFSTIERQPALHLDKYKQEDGGANPALRNTGIVFTAAGFATMVTGAILFIDGFQKGQFFNPPPDDPGVIESRRGVNAFYCGAVSAVVGGVIWIIGQHQLNHHKKSATTN